MSGKDLLREPLDAVVGNRAPVPVARPGLGLGFDPVPLSLLLLVFSNQRSWAHFLAIVWIVAVVTNCNFVALTAFYYAVWQTWRPRGVATYLLLGGVILPALG